VRSAHLPKTAFIAWRFYLLIIFILLIVLTLLLRLIDLTVIKRDFLLEKGNARALRIVTIPAFRGMISDRDGYPLAISTSVYSIWINPKEFSMTSKNILALSQILKMKKSDIQLPLEHYKNKNREFIYIKRDLSPEVAAKIKALAIPGVYEQLGYKRFYPEGEVAAHVVGFTNVDDEGQEGLELAYNQALAGVPGKKVVFKDRLGRVIMDVQSLQKQRSGSDLVLSLNHRIQYLAYRELLDGVKKYSASSGSVVVLDVKTGEVLAMVNYPSFNPNNHVITDREALRNRAVTDTFEPGSTIKAFSVAASLDSGLFKPDTVIDTNPGWLNVGHHLVRDEHRKGPMTVEQILEVSSNVGITKMILSIPPNLLWDFLNRVGFGAETGIGFPGERSGTLVKRDNWPPFTLATLAFGYGISVTPLQLAEAYSVIANDGVKIPVSLEKIDAPPKGKQVIKSKLCKEILTLLETVTTGKDGTARSARIPGYHVAGKTGTARLVGPHGYELHHHMSSFVGIAPATHPQIVVAVVLHDPSGKLYYGGDVSAPIFKNIMQGTLRILNIPPDDVEAKNNGINDHDKIIAADLPSL